MNKAVLNSMCEWERVVVAETERVAIVDLDEDELLELHSRVRRMRSKYVKNYRRGASGTVERAGGRGKAFAQNSRDRDRAEVFELALARVSARVDVVARAAAEDLKAERLAAVAATRGSTGPGSEPAGGRSSAMGASTRRRATKTTGGVKRDASSRAKGAARQAKKDSR